EVVLELAVLSLSLASLIGRGRGGLPRDEPPPELWGRASTTLSQSTPTRKRLARLNTMAFMRSSWTGLVIGDSLPRRWISIAYRACFSEKHHLSATAGFFLEKACDGDAST